MQKLTKRCHIWSGSIHLKCPQMIKKCSLKQSLQNHQQTAALKHIHILSCRVPTQGTSGNLWTASSCPCCELPEEKLEYFYLEIILTDFATEQSATSHF